MSFAAQHHLTTGFLRRRRPRATPACADANAATATARQYGGHRTVRSGPLLHATGDAARLVLTNVSLAVASGVLIESAANRDTSRTSAGHAELVAQDQRLTGSVVVDDVSSATLTLRDGSSLLGAVDTARSGGVVALALDGSSSWTVTGTSHVARITGLDLRGGTVRNIHGDGHSVYYDAASVPSLHGRTFALAGGGRLRAQ